jgi:hypothetical protein
MKYGNTAKKKHEKIQGRGASLMIIRRQSEKEIALGGMEVPTI